MIAPKLLRIQLIELQNIIINKLQGEESITDDLSVRDTRSKILQHGTLDAPPPPPERLQVGPGNL